MRSDRVTALLVITAEGIHPFPFRTRPLSPPAPKVLGAQASGRIGHRQGLSLTTTLAALMLRGWFAFLGSAGDDWTDWTDPTDKA